jgi:3,4-dihydroxy 2-butanone 4-phosphate synthase/GTP cyclohydrolase II
MNEPSDTIEEALADIAAGKLVIVTDDENRENEATSSWPASRRPPRRST